jgi:hypothetical protein
VSPVFVVIAVAVALPVLLLAVPVDVAFRFQGVGSIRGQVAIRGLFGLLRFRIQVPHRTKAQHGRSGIGSQSKKVRTRHSQSDRRAKALAVLRQAAFRRRVLRLIEELLGAAQLRQLGLWMRVGLGDPADTGRLWALVGPLNAVAHNLPAAEIRIEPEFVESAFEYEAEGRLLVVPLRILAAAAAFALSPSSIRAWRTLRRSHA